MADDLLAFKSTLRRAGIGEKPAIAESGKPFLFQCDAGTAVTRCPAQRREL